MPHHVGRVFHASCDDFSHREFMAWAEEENGEKYPYPGKRGEVENIAGFEFEEAGEESEEVILDLAALAAAPEKPKELKAFALTDAGNAERLVYWYGHGFRWCHEMGWLSWDGKRWEQDKTQRVMRAALKTVRFIPNELELHLGTLEDDKLRAAIEKSVLGWAKTSEAKTKLEAAVGLAQTMKTVITQIDKLDADPWLFNCANGTVDLRTQEFREHNRQDMITKMSPVVYDPKATCKCSSSELLRLSLAVGQATVLDSGFTLS
jgi:phage/plasmid-associated DNA primase